MASRELNDEEGKLEGFLLYKMENPPPQHESKSRCHKSVTFRLPGRSQTFWLPQTRVSNAKYVSVDL